MDEPHENPPLPLDTPQLPAPPHPLDLYRLAVQHPLAEVAFIEKAWSHYRAAEGQEASEQPMLLREDFAGTAAVAAAWVQSDPERQSIAVEIDPVTATWAQDTWCELNDRLEVTIADVMEMYTPPGDVTAALNFSAMMYHEQEHMLAYLRHCRSMLNHRGLLILDLFGGEGSRKTRTQTRRVDPDEGRFDPFEYSWEQHQYDPETERIDCRIHFRLDDGRELRDCFIYDWRLWRPTDLQAMAAEAGFSKAELWSDDADTPGRFGPLENEPTVEDWVGYMVFVV